MILLLSGANHKDAQQLDTHKSLGGLISSTPVPNGRINGLFSDLSNYTIQNKLPEIVGIFIKNNTANALINLSIQQIYDQDNLCKFEFAIVSVTETGAMELIGNKNEEPYHAEWFEATDVTLITDSFAADDVLGIWIRRTIISENIPESECSPIDSDNKDMDELLEVIFSHD